MIEAIVKGLGLGLVLAVSVGPVIFTILKQSINNGHKGGFSFVAGVWLSDIILVIISNMFSTLVHNALAFKSTISYTGASFVISLGIYYLFLKRCSSQTTIQYSFSLEEKRLPKLSCLAS